MATPDDYAWIHDSHLLEDGCVTVVPRADRAAVLAAYGVVEGSGVPFDDAGAEHLDPFEEPRIQVVDLGGDLLVLEPWGFEGMRAEVLGPLSRASGAGVAASYTWNVNHDTTFSTARDGTLEQQLDLYTVEEGDDELTALSPQVRALALAGAEEDDGDPIAAGVAMVAAHTGTRFTAADAATGTVYEIRPTPDAVESSRPTTTEHDDPLGPVPGASATVAALPGPTQRALAEWAVTAAVREAGMSDHPVLRELVAGFGAGRAAIEPTGLDPLARETAREHERFLGIERTDDGQWHGVERRAHPYYEAVVPSDFGPQHAVSHLEGCYLAQRRQAVEAARCATDRDDHGAAVGSLVAALSVFQQGRTTRGWVMEEDAAGRHRGDTLPDPRSTQAVAALAALVGDLATGAAGPEVWRRADLALPAPLTDHERVEAIHADALAAARGEFATWQTVDVEHDGWDHDQDDDADGDRDGAGTWSGVQRLTVVVGGDLGDEPDLDPALMAELRVLGRDTEREWLATEVARLDTVIALLSRPDSVLAVLAVIAGAPSALRAVDALATTFDLGDELARELLATRLRPVDAGDLARLRDLRDTLAAALGDDRSD